jgi:hypothetical protein
MRKVAYIIPGFTESTHDFPYTQIKEWLEIKSISVVPVNITWDLQKEIACMPSYVEQFLLQFQQHYKQGDEVYILGYSFGAMVAWIAAQEINPHTVILCSMSPFFKEYIAEHREVWNKKMSRIGVSDMQEYSFGLHAPQKTCAQVHILIGTDEPISITDWSKKVFDYLQGANIPATLSLAQGAPHNIKDSQYLTELQRIIEQL